MGDNYAILHVRRIKTASHAKILERHCKREYGAEKWQTHPERADENKWICDEATINDAREKELERHHLVRKPRSDACYCLEFVVTASREFGDVREYLAESLVWINKKAPAFAVALHCDEKTPHLHIYALPLVKRGDGWVYSADGVLGDRKKMEQLQEEFWQEVGRRFGLVRGVKSERKRERGERVGHTGLSAYKSKSSRERVTDRAVKRPTGSELGL